METFIFKCFKKTQCGTVPHQSIYIHTYIYIYIVASCGQRYCKYSSCATPNVFYKSVMSQQKIRATNVMYFKQKYKKLQNVCFCNDLGSYTNNSSVYQCLTESKLLTAKGQQLTIPTCITTIGLISVEEPHLRYDNWLHFGWETPICITTIGLISVGKPPPALRQLASVMEALSASRSQHLST